MAVSYNPTHLIVHTHLIAQPPVHGRPDFNQGVGLRDADMTDDIDDEGACAILRVDFLRQRIDCVMHQTPIKNIHSRPTPIYPYGSYPRIPDAHTNLGDHQTQQRS